MAKLSKKFGLSFNDEMARVTRQYKHVNPSRFADLWQESLITRGRAGDEDEVTTSPWRIFVIMALLIIAFFAIFLRLFHLQIARGDDYRSLADSNRIQVRTIHAPRGVIYDRNGQILAQNEPGFRLREASGAASTQYLTRDQALKLEVSNDPRLKDLEIDNLRSYPLKEKTAHVLGYVSEITAEELRHLDFQAYKPGDRIGRTGVEQVYEKVLRGIDGGEVIEVDASGQKIRTLGKTDPIPGQNIYLTLDAGLQETAYDQLEKGTIASKSCCAAAVIQDPQTGQILSLVSYPSFDPENLDAAFLQPNFPFLNRAIAGTYPPGSTFKIATALAGLQSGRITPQTQITDTGVIYLGPYKFTNWYFTQYGQTEKGPVDVVRALQRSNDTFFYQLGELAGEVIMGEGAKKLGFGRQLGIDLPGEEAGLIPTDQWKRDNYDQQWYPGDSLHMAIGQGFVLVTPLQISHLISAIAADGKQYPPHLALKITNPDGHQIKSYHYDPTGPVYSVGDINLIKTGLELVTKPGGTAWPFFNFPISTSGKTGTAEFGDPDKTHAWYTAYAPVNHPQISATVLIEGGGEGSTNASPIVKELFRWYFSPDKQNLIKDINLPATASARPASK